MISRSRRYLNDLTFKLNLTSLFFGQSSAVYALKARSLVKRADFVSMIAFLASLLL